MCIHSIIPAADNIRSVSIPTVLQQWSQLWVGVISVKPVCSVILRTWWSENKRPGEDCPLLAVQCNEIMEKQICKETTYILKCRQELSISVQCCVHFKPADNICFSEAHCTHRISSSLQNSVLTTGTMQRVPTQNKKKNPVSRSYQVHRNMIYHALMHEFTTSRELIKQAKRGKKHIYTRQDKNKRENTERRRV